MTGYVYTPDRSLPQGRDELPSHRSLSVLFLGAAIGALVGLALYVTKTAYVALLPISLGVVLPALCIKNFRLYWFTLFLFSLQLPLSKNLNDGLAVVERLKINYAIWNFTFEITATDVLLLILLIIWANDSMFHGRRLRFPEATWLALGYLLICFLSTLRAAFPYLGLVEMWRLVKLFIVYLFAVNCVDSKSALRTLTMVAVIILVTQAAVTVVRFETGYYTPFGFGETPSGLGETQWDKSEIEHYLTVDQSAQGSAIRSFGTITSPGSTARLCAMVLPFALFLCVPNPMFRRPFVFAPLTAFAVVGLVLTFTRVYYITIAAQFVIAFFIMVRDRILKREQAVMVALLSLAVVAAATPMLRHQFSVRKESMSVRLHQYATTFRMILDRPLLGVGLNNGTAEKPKYVTVTYNPYDPDTHFDLEPTHNTYLSLASEIGVIGAFLFVAFFTRVALTAWQHSRHSTDPETRLVANALVVAFFGLAVNGLMDPLHEYPVLVLLWLYAGLSLNLEAMAQRFGDHESPAIRRKP